METEKPSSLVSLLINFRPHFENADLAWFSLILFFIFFGDFTGFFKRRNLDILLLYALCPFMEIVWKSQRLAFGGLFAVTSLFFLRCLAGALPHKQAPVEPNVSKKRVAAFVLALTVLFHVQTAYEKGIDDSGLWSLIGGQYLKESGQLPYGQEFGHVCIYGPLMYVFHIPMNIVFPSNVTIDHSTGLVDLGKYEEIEMRGAQSTALLFDLLAILAIYCFGLRYHSKTTGIYLALAYALNPYVLCMGGAWGLRQASHMSGIPFVLFAFVFVGRPWLAGLLLGIASGIIYYPAFLFPLWLGYYFKNHGSKEALSFLASFMGVGVFCLVMILALTVPGQGYEGLSPLEAFIRDTIYQQQFKEGYGTSPFSFWAKYPSIGQWGKKVAGVFFLLFSVLAAFVPKKLDFRRLVAMTAAILVGTQLVLSHAGGTYIGFYIAPLLLVLLGPQNEESATQPVVKRH